MIRNLLVLALLMTGCATTVHRSTADHAHELSQVLERWDHEDPADLRGVIILQDGRVVSERYYGEASGSDLHDVRSAGKSITGLLAAIAIDHNLLSGFDAAVADYWPEAADTALGRASVGDLLSMRSGLAADDDDPASPGLEDHMDEADNPLQFILDLPPDGEPGQAYRYNSATASAAGVLIARVADRSMGDFARETLFTPLNIHEWRWDGDRSGYTKGQGNLRLRLRDFAAIGEMVRKGGVYEGRRVVNQATLERLMAPQVRISTVDPYADTYGGFWYEKTYQVGARSVTVHFASGNGGNKLYVIPERGMVVAIQSAAYGRGYGQRRSEAILLAVLAAAE